MAKTYAMPRPNRYTPGGLVYHVLNRSVGGRTLFEKDGDYLCVRCALLDETLRTRPMRVCAYCDAQPLAFRRVAASRMATCRRSCSN